MYLCVRGYRLCTCVLGAIDYVLVCWGYRLCTCVLGAIDYVLVC